MNVYIYICACCMCTHIGRCGIIDPNADKRRTNMALTDAQKKANAKYREKAIKRIPLDVPKEDYENIKGHSEAMGESVNGFIKRAIAETMERDSADSEE